MKSCSFFGHRDTLITLELEENVRKIVERLIVEEEVDTFLFGTRSSFYELCHRVVTELQKQYPHICRVIYLCKHESACLVGAGTSLKQQIKQITGQDVYVGEYEEIKKSDRVNSAGKASYVERNFQMVDDSEIVMIYLEDFKCLGSVSGALKIYQYAIKNKKVIIKAKK